MKLVNELPREITDNSAFENILTRVSVRRFSATPVSDSQLTALCRAAMSAPSGVGKHPSGCACAGAWGSVDLPVSPCRQDAFGLQYPEHRPRTCALQPYPNRLSRERPCTDG